MVGDSFDVKKIGFLYLTVVKISDQNRKSLIIVNPTEVHAMSSADDILAGYQSPATEEECGCDGAHTGDAPEAHQPGILVYRADSVSSRASNEGPHYGLYSRRRPLLGPSPP